MGRPVHGNTESFIIRIWYEETDGEDGALVRRGSIEHVSSKRRIFFQDLGRAVDFIENQIEATASLRDG